MAWLPAWDKLLPDKSGHLQNCQTPVPDRIHPGNIPLQ